QPCCSVPAIGQPSTPKMMRAAHNSSVRLGCCSSALLSNEICRASNHLLGIEEAQRVRRRTQGVTGSQPSHLTRRLGSRRSLISRSLSPVEVIQMLKRAKSANYLPPDRNRVAHTAPRAFAFRQSNR